VVASVAGVHRALANDRADRGIVVTRKASMAEQIVRILSIDGGGIRGIIPAFVIQNLEQRTGRAMRDLFHMIAGTSTGGLLACGLARPSTPMSGAELEELYVNNGPKIFARSLWDGVRSGERRTSGMTRTGWKRFWKRPSGATCCQVLMVSNC
jgi:predicted acylesterase/phospholipase RssA